MKLLLLAIAFALACFTISCNNRSEVKDSKKENISELKEIESDRIHYEDSIIKLNADISELSQNQGVLKDNEEYAKAEIYSIVKESYLDHVIIGTEDLHSVKEFLANNLGFTLKEGRIHNNGISNQFIEFEDQSEIEFISISNPKDKLAAEYDSLIQNRQYGLRFAIRTNNILKLKSNFKLINNDYNEFLNNDAFTILSKNNIDLSIPVFFIQFKNHRKNDHTNHINDTERISAVWLTTKKIRNSISAFSDLGFKLIDTIKISGINERTALMKNNNFDVIFIEGKQNELSGITLKVKNIAKLKKQLDNSLNRIFKVTSNKRGKSITLNPEVTNSIWFEFLE